jgi:hypothetical protein
MISTHRPTGSLLGEIRSRRGAQARLAQPVEDLEGRQPRGLAHVVDLHRRVCVQVKLRGDVAGQPQPSLVVLERPVGVDPGLDAELGCPELDGGLHAPDELRPVVLVGVG